MLKGASLRRDRADQNLTLPSRTRPQCPWIGRLRRWLTSKRSPGSSDALNAKAHLDPTTTTTMDERDRSEGPTRLETSTSSRHAESGAGDLATANYETQQELRTFRAGNATKWSLSICRIRDIAANAHAERGMNGAKVRHLRGARAFVEDPASPASVLV